MPFDFDESLEHDGSVFEVWIESKLHGSAQTKVQAHEVRLGARGAALTTDFAHSDGGGAARQCNLRQIIEVLDHLRSRRRASLWATQS